MELMKNQVAVYKRENEAFTQMTLDEDYNVPDSCEDVGRLIQYQGRIQIEDVKVSESRVFITGILCFKILFAIDQEPNFMESLEGSVPFEESMNVKGISTGEKICLRWDLEDLNIQLIHSRKMNIRALAAFTAIQELEKELSFTSDLRKEGVSQKKEKIQVLGLHVHNRDTIRIRDTFVLSSNKPNIDKLVWDSMDVRGVHVRTEEGRILVKGEVFAFFLYEDDTESNALQWLEYSLPFQKEIVCEGCTQDMIPEMDITIINTSLTVKPDSDGEERCIQVDLLMESDLKVYKEKEIELLLDVYHPTCHLVPEMEMIHAERLLIKNYAKCRIQERVSIDQNTGRILQICHSEGVVRIEESRMIENGILVDGFVQIQILYVTGIDEMPFYSVETMVPFSVKVEAPGIDETCKWYLHGELEQLSTTMSDGSAIDVKAFINLNALVLSNQSVENIVNVETKEWDSDHYKKIPGIVGYVVQPKDTLWDIAKRFCTTVDQIKSVNQLKEDTISPNDILILVKEVC